MSEVKWTPEQQQAIESRGGTLLVSAAAGSGKTAVLVERVIGYITHPEHPVDADRLLVVTFSNAAAQEMRQRIASRLWEMLRADPGNTRLERQQLLLDSAQISTVHGFCSNLVRTYFHRIGLPAQFRVAEDQELRVLQKEVLNGILQKMHEESTPEFLDLAELLSGTRNDQKLDETILRLYTFVRNHPFYHRWMDNALEQYHGDAPLMQTPWGHILMDYSRQALDHCLALCDTAIIAASVDQEINDAYVPTLLSDRDRLADCLEAVLEGDWNTCWELINSLTFDRMGSLSSQYPDQDRKARVMALRQEIKDIIKKLRVRCFFMPASGYSHDAARQYPLMKKIFEIVHIFDHTLAEVKLERGILDFDDQQHYALALLYKEQDGKLIPTDIAEDLARRFEEVLVDEYQDTNQLQEQIFAAISRDGENLFMVGDVKQSVYRFRHARPELFLQKKNAYPTFDGNSYPGKITLGANFRTRSETTGVINHVFRMIMNPTVGEMDYREEDHLVARADFAPEPECPVSMVLLDGKGVEGREQEATYVATEIRRLLDAGTLIRNGNETRPVTPGDICILMRSRNKMNLYIKALDDAGLAHWEERRGGFLESREIAPVVAYLKLLANPMLDLELAQLLMSYLYGFTSQDIAALRTSEGGSRSLYLSMLQAAEQEPSYAAFLEDYQALRRLTMESSAQEVLLHLYTRTGAQYKARAMSQGEAREANLRRLLEYAAAQENSGRDFGDFVSYLYALAEFDTDLPGASVAAGNAVSLMSVHKSKGLEFPVVFFVGLGAEFNTRDMQDDVQLHPELGVAGKYRDNRRLIQHETLSRMALALENQRGMLSEEMRILYVAMTRAKEHLYLVGTDSEYKGLKAGAWQPLEGGRLSPWSVRSASNMLDWLLPSFCHHPDVPEEYRAQKTFGDAGRLRLVLPMAEVAEEVAETAEKPAPQADFAAESQLEKVLAFTYPYMKETVTPSKLSVSQLTHSATVVESAFTRRPQVLTSRYLTPVERGVAAHKFMQFASYQNAANDLEREITRLQDAGFITPEEAREVNRRTLSAFFEGPLGQRIMSGDQVYREIRFLREFTPQELAAIDPTLVIEASTVVQGVADCVVVKDGKGLVVDYKTDRIKTPEELLDRYRTQLRLYKAILEEYLAIPITEMVIYSFSLSQEVEVV